MVTAFNSVGPVVEGVKPTSQVTSFIYLYLHDSIQFMKGIDAVTEELRSNPSFMDNVTHWEEVPPGKGRYALLPEDLHPRIKKALESSGIGELFSHQREAYDSIRRGKDTIIVTPTASGKTLCYNVPVLQTLLEQPEARALYIFPTKALSQDQQAELNSLVDGGSLPVKVNTYDGDTPQSIRVAAREKGRIIVSNPDMLHSGILPNHPKWISFLSALRIIVIDEVHIYRGVFGSHMTNLIRRLKRITSFYGSQPLFMFCSATIGNPKDLAEKILEKEVHLIDKSGAPSGKKHIVLYNPPLVDHVQGIRRGVVLESKRLAISLLKRGIKTIVFARSRVRTELIASYINASLKNVFTENSRIRVESYRGGYLPKERRAVEAGLRDGTIKGVVSTNALELGIDIGGLDASILAGLPGSIASAWQQAGRAGRKTDSSLALMVASASPRDQYIIAHPEYFFTRSPESAWIDPDNMFILLDHLKCAVFELPFREDESFGGDVKELLEHLEESGVVRFTEGMWYWSQRSYPAEQISLRSASSENVVIIDTTGGKNLTIGEMDRPSAQELLFDGAIYIHRGEQYVVIQLDIENKACYVERKGVNFYTDAIVKRDIKVLYTDTEDEKWGVRTIMGDVLVRSQVTKFKKIRYNTHENLGYGDIFLPEEEMHTRSICLIFHEATSLGKVFHSFSEDARRLIISRIGSLFKNTAPVFVLCDPRDFGVAERLRDPHFGSPALYIYDSYPGGTGLTEGFYAAMEKILRASLEVVELCPCERGCPSCIGPEEPGAENSLQPKEEVLSFLSQWVGVL